MTTEKTRRLKQLRQDRAWLAGLSFSVSHLNQRSAEKIHYANGSTPSPAKFNTAPPANNCGNCGWRLSAIANGTISNTMTRMPRYCTIFGQGAGIQ